MRVNKTAVASVLGGAVMAATALLVPLEGVGTKGNPGKVYRDIAGVLTDCYGNTKNVVQGVTRTQAQCEALLEGEVTRIARMIYNDLPGIKQRELVALTLFTYNVGDGGYRGSTTRRQFKAGNSYEGCTAMRMWNKITRNGIKVVSNGLVNRRTYEVGVCLGTVQYWQ